MRPPFVQKTFSLRVSDHLNLNHIVCLFVLSLSLSFYLSFFLRTPLSYCLLSNRKCVTCLIRVGGSYAGKRVVAGGDLQPGTAAL